MARRKQNAIDKQIEQTYYRHGQNVQISVLDIPRVFEIGRQAIANGADLDAAIVGAIAAYRKN